MRTTYYFTHDANAANDPALIGLRAIHGWEGYGIYWMLLECMFAEEDTRLAFKNMPSYAFAFRIDDSSLLVDIVDEGVRLGLFIVEDNDYFYSESLRESKGRMISTRQRRSEAGKKGMASRWSRDEDVKRNVSITNDNKEKERIEEKEKIKADFIRDVIGILNEVLGSTFRASSALAQRHISARIAENYTLEDFRTVIEYKVNEWRHDEKLKIYLRPETLFGTKFDGYLVSAKAWKGSNQNYEHKKGDIIKM